MICVVEYVSSIKHDKRDAQRTLILEFSGWNNGDNGFHARKEELGDVRGFAKEPSTFHHPESSVGHKDGSERSCFFYGAATWSVI